MTVTNVLVSCTAALAIAGVAFAVDSEPHMKVKVCNPAETFCANVNANLGLHSNLRDSAGAEIGIKPNPLYIIDKELATPSTININRVLKVVGTGATNVTTFTIAANVALNDFHFGGRGIGQASIFIYDAAATQFIPGGGFNSIANVALWTNAGIGSSSGLTWAYSTAQAFEGTGSATVTFTQSDVNNFPAIKYTFSSATDFTAWRYINARAFVTVATGGVQSRTISIILTDTAGATRTYSVVGTTTTAPFSTAQWVQILGEIEAPTSETGVFDDGSVASMTLKLQDGGNKSGSIFWDDVKFISSQNFLETIYTSANMSTEFVFRPSRMITAGQVLGISIKNNDAASKEFTSSVSGIER